MFILYGGIETLVTQNQSHLESIWYHFKVPLILHKQEHNLSGKSGVSKAALGKFVKVEIMLAGDPLLNLSVYNHR